MATVRPFRGIVFDPTRVSDLGQVTCPPYDVISPAERTQLYDLHPYNVVRIISGREEPQDSAADNRYTRAAAFFRSWQWEGVLREDVRPALYVYRQAFEDPSGAFRRVWGLLATISLDDEVLAHEHTMSGPKADRLALMEAVPANISPIYALYSQDGEAAVSSLLPEHATGQSVADFTDSDGTRHTVWAVHDAGFHAAVAEALDGLPLMIADGHHRFETARTYRRRRAEADGPGPWDRIMALLVDAAIQPVCILPYHRIVRRAGAGPMDVLKQRFEVTELGPARPEDVERWALELWTDNTPGTFVAVVGEHAYRIVSHDVRDDDIPAGVLRRCALEPMGATSAEDHLSFTPRAGEVCEEVVSGRAAAGFCMQPVGVDRVWRLAESGAQMPEKSTYFHPKPKDGIVMRSLEPREEDEQAPGLS